VSLDCLIGGVCRRSSDDNKNPDEAIQRHQPHNAQKNDNINPMRQSRDTSNTRHKAQNDDKPPRFVSGLFTLDSFFGIVLSSFVVLCQMFPVYLDCSLVIASLEGFLSSFCVLCPKLPLSLDCSLLMTSSGFILSSFCALCLVLLVSRRQNNSEKGIQSEQSRDKGNIGHKTHKEDKKNRRI
jgi:hypothetical protein